ncbi:DNA-binding IclR family transcriptional regulator [Variovorax boronicumulans]|uniref:IclR family transcriptional regulator n=1 Tax=Variovorax boronicumulans TaxID=436515 RepID=UPI002780F8D2|nr:IclR family transcriptional regulator C-terminal domain-containing protein [Variovorax boronicumulans]MDP9995288.1 DNA-binding IclR family transcriptional regulator [Variovorax boronicumulans]MDQ0006578.1 DNA-binding IclR family transcriptional regulator [Variovorax boronicumulans]MDQ0044331.1 DNA-binding IclR family transcriptional regulator [Variovorax boronicumulans]
MNSSFAKGLSILEYFKEGRISGHLDDFVEMLGASKATVYRYIATLCEAGLLSPLNGGVYVLGPKIIELDRLMRISDPLLLAGSRVMHEISARRKLNMMLASYYRDSIMCVDIAWPDASIPARFERGRPMSLFRGAMAKVILANLSPYKLRSVALHQAEDIRAAGLGDNWLQFRGTMAEIAKQGYAVTKAEMMPKTGGISSPIFDKEGKILGSITFVVGEAEWNEIDFEKLRRWIQDAAKRISEAISAAETETGTAPTLRKLPSGRKALAESKSTRP